MGGEVGSVAVSARGHANPLGRIFGQSVFWITLVDVLLIIAFGILNQNFIGVANFQALALDACEIVLLATGEAYLLGAGEFDISLGANLVLSSVVGAVLLVNISGSPTQVQSGHYPHLQLGIIVGVLTALLTGLAMGLANGLIVTKLRVNSLIATLATLGIATGIAEILTNGGDVAYVPTVVQTRFGILYLGNIAPLPSLVVVVILVLSWALLTKTRFGMRTLALGSSREAASRAGLPVERELIILFLLAGLLAAFAGIIDLTRFATTDIAGHQTDALAAIAGAVIGGTALQGGQASVGGAVAGAFLAVILQSGLVMVGLSPFYQYIAVGVVLIAAVHLDQRRRESA